MTHASGSDSIKMASAQQKAFCVLEFAKTKSVITVQRAFRVKFNCDAPSSKNIRRWSKQFEKSGCLCKGKSPGRPRTSEENVERVRAAFSQSPRQSTRRVSRALGISQPTVWRVLKNGCISNHTNCNSFRRLMTMTTNDEWNFATRCCK